MIQSVPKAVAFARFRAKISFWMPKCYRGFRKTWWKSVYILNITPQITLTCFRMLSFFPFLRQLPKILRGNKLIIEPGEKAMNKVNIFFHRGSAFFDHREVKRNAPVPPVRSGRVQNRTESFKLSGTLIAYFNKQNWKTGMSRAHFRYIFLSSFPPRQTPRNRRHLRRSDVCECVFFSGGAAVHKL